jgi:hypothetical protein
MMFQPTDKITLILEARQWEAIMQLMSDGPYRVVAPLLAELQGQWQRQLTPPAPMVAPSPALKVVGAEEDAAE